MSITLKTWTSKEGNAGDPAFGRRWGLRCKTCRSHPADGYLYAAVLGAALGGVVAGNRVFSTVPVGHHAIGAKLIVFLQIIGHRLSSATGKFHVVLCFAGIVGVTEQRGKGLRLLLEKLSDPIELFLRRR